MGLEFQDVSHSYGEETVLNGINLLAHEGEVTCLLGPSGCGKTTLLRLAAGLMPLQAGKVLVSGETVAEPALSIPPEKRPVGLVFQEGALFPHMTVEANIAFGLTGNKSVQQSRIDSLLSTIGLEGYGDRYPHTLSGGQQQRVALARALAPSPAVLLLDEPFANIDSELRKELREETRQTLKASGTAAILVTHDPDEALEMADRIAVMEKGVIVQFDTPTALLTDPATAKIAKLFGRCQSIVANVQETELLSDFGRWSIESIKNNLPVDKNIELVVSNNSLVVSKDATSDLTISDVRQLEETQTVFVKAQKGSALRIVTRNDQKFEIGEKVSLLPEKSSLFAFSSSE